MSLTFSLSSQPYHPKPRLKAGLKGNLGDHGVRKYDSEIGRFLAIDPLWEKYNTLNPYQYSGNSPVNTLDKNGLFGIQYHMTLDIEAQYNQGMSISSYFGSIFEQLFRESFEGADWLFYSPIKHLDNMDNTQFSTFLQNGGYSKLDRHQTQDFYSHSNYVELMKKYGGYGDDDIPTFDQLNSDSDIYKEVMSRIRTTIYPDKGEMPGHDGVYKNSVVGRNDDRDDNFQAKDNPSVPGFDAAYNTALKATIIWYQNNK